MKYNEEGIITGKIIGCAMEVHRQMGPGLLESVYEECLCYELGLVGLLYEKQKSLAIIYKGQEIANKLRIDLIVENEIVIELKSVKRIEPIHEAQLLTYLKLSNKKHGLLINFNSPKLKDGIKRIAN